MLSVLQLCYYQVTPNITPNNESAAYPCDSTPLKKFGGIHKKNLSEFPKCGVP